LFRRTAITEREFRNFQITKFSLFCKVKFNGGRGTSLESKFINLNKSHLSVKESGQN